MEASKRTRKWREKRAAEGKKSYTVLLSTDAQQVIKSEKERSGENYSIIVERALMLLSAQAPAPHSGIDAGSGKKNEVARENVTSDEKKVTNLRILIDDFQNYELNEENVQFGYKKNPEYGLAKKENFFSRLVKSRSGKKRWFK